MIKQNINSVFHTKFSVGILLLFSTSTFAAPQTQLSIENALSFDMAIKTAQKNDPWLTGNVHKQRAIDSMSIAVGTLPDPKVSIALANLPTNGFDFGQEAMTQAQIGIAQVFPRGDTLDIKSQQLRIQSEAFPFQRHDREAKVAVTVGNLWLDAYRVQQSIALIEKNRSLFEQLADIAEASYSSALGKTRQQDIVRAQLELTRLDERLDTLGQHKNRYEGLLLQWLSTFSIDNDFIEKQNRYSNFALHNMVLSEQIPEIALLNPSLVKTKNWLKPGELVAYFTRHPSVVALDKKISATKIGIKLAEQKYRPEWAVNANYGHRANDPMGVSRADLFSVGVSFDLPIFTQNRQDKEVQSAISETEAIRTEKLLLLREFLGAYSSAKGRLQRLKDQQQLYKSKLLPQIHDQAEASLTAYTNDDGDFAEVVRSRIAVLNTEIDELALNVEEQKLNLELNYLFIGSIKTAMTKNDTTFTKSSQYTATSGEK